jgi:UDP-glucose-4-epimerase GalE
MARVLVTGGAGYVGSHIVRRLVESGHDVVVVDDLSAGHRRAVRGARLVVADFADETALDDCLGSGVRWVFHMAAFCEVGASCAEPADYYRNNLTRSLTLLDAARRHGVSGIVFSSTAAVYGEPNEVPIPEEHATRPTNPYGETKLAFERALAWYGQAYGVRSVALRYFNAAGAHPSGEIGEDHDPESHLVPRLLRSALDGAEEIPIFGDDWPTRDGTCVRDYVHVADLAEAHVLAMRAMEAEETVHVAYNLGNGDGFTVLEVVDAVRRVTGRRPRTRSAPRRAGDPAVLVASSERARRELGWEPAYPSLDAILETAWRWHREHPAGYDGA